MRSGANKLSSCAGCRIRTQGIWNRISSRLNVNWQTDWAIEDQANSLNSKTCPRQWAFSPFDPTTGWLSHWALPIYMLAVVNFDALAQARYFRIAWRKLSSCAEYSIWTQGLLNRISSRLNVHWQTDWAIKDHAKSLNSITCPYDQRAFSPLDPTTGWLSHLPLAIYILVVVNFEALAQASDFRIERRQVVFLCWMQGSKAGSLEPNPQ